MTTDSVDNDWSLEGAGDIDENVRMLLLARRLPRAELHVHLTGALRASFLQSPVRGRGPDATLDYVDVETFFTRHSEIARSLLTETHVAQATRHVLLGAVDTGCRHVELSINSTEFDSARLSLDAALDGVGAAFDELKRSTGLTGGVIVATDRNSNLDDGLATVDAAARARKRGVPVLGIGNDGFPSRRLIDFAPVYARARDQGFRTTGHANKPRDIADALDLELDRIDHAWELLDQPDLAARAAKKGTPITMALTSCLIMLPGRFPTADSFPLEKLRRLGVAVTLNVDDAAMFFTDSAQEYALVARTFGYTGQDLGELALASLEAAWLDDDRDTRLDSWRTEIRDLVTDPRNPQPKNFHS